MRKYGDKEKKGNLELGRNYLVGNNAQWKSQFSAKKGHLIVKFLWHGSWIARYRADYTCLRKGNTQSISLLRN